MNWLREWSRLLRVVSVVLVAGLSLLRPRVASADEPEVKGHIPVLRIGVAGGAAIQPYSYTTYEGTDHGLDPNTFAPITTWAKTKATDSRPSGMFGPEVRLRLDLGSALVYRDAFYNAVQDSQLELLTHGGVVIGGRSSMALTVPAGSTCDGQVCRDYYHVYPGKLIPVVYGLLLGRSRLCLHHGAARVRGRRTVRVHDEVARRSLGFRDCRSGGQYSHLHASRRSPPVRRR